MKKREVAIVGAARTAIGKFGGTLAGVPAERLGAVAISAAMERAGISAYVPDEVFMGCVLQAGLGQNAARQAAIHAGIPVETPATTINNVCGSGLKTVNLAAALIASGEADCIVAGGMENMSSAPYLLKDARYGYRMNDGKLVDSMINDALWDTFGDCHMGITAENIAKEYCITREQQDIFAAESQQKCERARAAKKFADEIVPVIISGHKGNTVFDTDEYPRDGVTSESIANLRPAFVKEGTVTAANSSGINDGAAAVVLMSIDKVKALGLNPLARFIVGTSVGIKPEVMGLGAAYAAVKSFGLTGLSADNMTIIEANEAFAVQSLACAEIGGWNGKNSKKVNVNGGAIALGHPVGASGCRILVTMIYELIRRGGGNGLCTLCVGGGMGVAAIIEA